MKRINPFTPLFIIISACLLIPLTLHAGEKSILSKGQTIYVPAYSHIYHADNQRPFLLTVTLIIRNTDPNHQIEILSADYYQSQGEFLKKLSDKPAILKPLESLRHIIPEMDKSGGSGANFIVKWRSGKPVNPPIIESIMIGTKMQQGISFTSRGQEILKTE